GALAVAGKIDNSTSTGSVGQRVMFDGLSGSSNVYVTLTSPTGAGTPINSNNPASDVAPYTLTEAGTYTLMVFTTGQNTGAYSFRLLDAGAAPALSLPVVGQTGTLNPGNAITLYTFTGTAGQRVTVSSGSGGSFSVALYNQNNQALVNVGSGGTQQATLLANGLYIVAVIGSGSSPVSYTFDLSAV